MKKQDEISPCNQFHDEAMQLADQAFDKEKKGNHAEAKKLFLQAYENERSSAMILVNQFEEEPSRSVLFRSAAWLAFHAGRYREAERMAAFGLSGNPPGLIEKELREVLEQTLAKLKAASPLTELA